INEVAQCLVGTNVTLGIIPVGSGNGLASHLSIPKDIAAALEIIKSGQHSKIDAGSINGQYFFSNTGSGFDAQVIKRYAQSNGRTLWAYVKAAVAAAFVFKPRKAVITCNGETISARPFLLFVSNSNQMGYNMGLTPMASLSDGLLDVVIVPELTFFEKLSLGYYVLTHNISGFKKAQHITTDTLNIELPEHIFTDVQIDGEYHNIKTNILEISILPGALNVFPGKKNA
ncbi:MAG: diacylglycerol kinase family protein, partial [Bacteroidota bacterium]